VLITTTQIEWAAWCDLHQRRTKISKNHAWRENSKRQ